MATTSARLVLLRELAKSYDPHADAIAAALAAEDLVTDAAAAAALIDRQLQSYHPGFDPAVGPYQEAFTIERHLENAHLLHAS
jgi:hypothetical protein